jgi:hypothetical protein
MNGGQTVVVLGQARFSSVTVEGEHGTQEFGRR